MNYKIRSACLYVFEMRKFKDEKKGVLAKELKELDRFKTGKSEAIIAPRKTGPPVPIPDVHSGLCLHLLPEEQNGSRLHDEPYRGAARCFRPG